MDSSTNEQMPSAPASPSQGRKGGGRRRWIRPVGLVATGLVAGGVLAGTLTAAAQTSAPSPAPSPATVAGERADRPAETALTGTVADKVKAAALAAVPGGTIVRVENDAEGAAYEAHMIKADGSDVTIKLDQSFKVTAAETGHEGRRGGRGPGRGETALTGDTAEKVKVAALAAVPGGTIVRVENDADGSAYEAHMIKADGSEVSIKLDKSFRVTATETRHGGPGRMDRNGGPMDRN